MMSNVRGSSHMKNFENYCENRVYDHQYWFELSIYYLYFCTPPRASDSNLRLGERVYTLDRRNETSGTICTHKLTINSPIS
jgi:hypothetical protein